MSGHISAAQRWVTKVLRSGDARSRAIDVNPEQPAPDSYFIDFFTPTRSARVTIYSNDRCDMEVIGTDSEKSLAFESYDLRTQPVEDILEGLFNSLAEVGD